MIITLSRDGQHVADLEIDDMRDWTEVCHALAGEDVPRRT